MLPQSKVRSERHGRGSTSHAFAVVCYELGLAHALGKRVFLVAEDPAACRIDFGALRVSAFDPTQTGRERMSRELAAFVATPGMLSPIDVVTGTLLGTTPGQRLMGLIVTRLERSPPSPWQRFLRPIAALVTVLTCGAGFFWAARSPRHQAVHDLITRTLVLRR